MRNVARILLRIALAIGGYIAAVLAAGVAAWSCLSFAAVAAAVTSTDKSLWGALLTAIITQVITPAVALLFSPWTIVLTAKVSFLPWLLTATAAEVLGIRSPYLYAGAGVVVGAIAVLQDVQSFRSVEDIGLTTTTMIAAGLVGGIVYWATAGRLAGRWLSPIDM